MLVQYMIPTKGWSIFSGLPRRLLHFKNVQFILNLLEILVMIFYPKVAICRLATSICWPWYCTLHVCCFSFFARLCNLINWNRIRASFIVCLYLNCRWRSDYQDERVGIPLTGLTTPHVCACPKPRHGFPTVYVAVFFCVQ